MHKKKIEKQLKEKRKENKEIQKMKKEKSAEKSNLMTVKRQMLRTNWNSKLEDLNRKNNMKNDLKQQLENEMKTEMLTLKEINNLRAEDNRENRHLWKTQLNE
jgi:hypothetical protein